MCLILQTSGSYLLKTKENIQEEFNKSHHHGQTERTRGLISRTRFGPYLNFSKNGVKPDRISMGLTIKGGLLSPLAPCCFGL